MVGRGHRGRSIVCQFKIDTFFAHWHDETEQFVNFHHYTLRPHVFLSTSHLRTLYIENHRPDKLFTYMYIMASTVKITLESTVILLICHFVALFVLKQKRVGIWLQNQMYKYLVTWTSRSPPCVPSRTTATAPSGLRIVQMSGQFSWLRHWADSPLYAAT